MSAAAVLVSEISRLKKGVRRITLARTILLAFVIFLATVAVMTGIAKSGIWQPQTNAPVLIGLFGLCLAFAVTYTFFARKSLMDILIDIDRRHKLHDRISTAYECHTSGRTSEISELLIADAGETLRRLSKSQIFPHRPTGLFAVLLGLMALNTLLLSVDRLAPGPRSATPHPHSEQLAAVRTMLQDYTAKKPQTSLAAENTPDSEVARKLQAAIQRLAEPSTTADDLRYSLNSILNDVHDQQRRLAQALSQTLGSVGLKEIPVLQIPERQTHSSQDLNRLQEMLGQLFDGEIPEDIQRSFDLLNEHAELDEMLTELIDQLHPTKIEPSDGPAAPSATAQGSRETASGHDRPNDSSDGRASEEQYRAGGGNRASAGSNAKRDPNEPRQGTEDGVALSAGGQKGSDQKAAPHELESAAGPALKDRVGSKGGLNYRVLIRSSASSGRPGLNGQDIIRPYRQEVESILRQEDIPQNYREYIKNYFLAIGLRTEEKSYDLDH